LKKLSITSLIALLFFMNIILSKTITKTINEYSTVINGSKELINYITTKDHIKITENILKNLDLFNQETNRFNSFKISKIYLTPKTTDFNNLLIKAEIKEKKFKFQKKYLITSIKTNKEGKILSFSFIEENIADKKKQNFTIFNQSYDSKGNLIKRLIIKSKQTNKQNLPDGYQEFINGTTIEYGNYNKAYFPATVKIKHFILNSFGDIKFIKIEESTNRKYNNRGFIIQETSKKTTFPFSKATPFSIYNLSFDSNFNIKSFEVIFPGDKNNTFYKIPQNYNVTFNKYKRDKFIEKTIRKFSIDNKIKTFINGRTVKRKISKDKAIKTTESFFEVKKGTKGLKRDNRIYKESREVYNLNFDKQGNILNRTIINTTFLSEKNNLNNKNNKQSLKSLKKIQYKYIGRKISNAKINFFIYNKDKKLTKTRILNINITSFDKTGAPLKVIIKSTTPDNPSSDFEKTFSKNTTYIIQDAIFGFRYFIIPKMKFIPMIKKISDRGEIEEINFIDKK